MPDESSKLAYSLHLRVQDLVAKVAGVSLNDTVRVLRALSVVLPEMDEPGCASRIQKLLSYRGDVEKPTQAEARACTAAYLTITEKYGFGILKRVRQCVDSGTGGKALRGMYE